ncbi:MAG: phospholipase/carboxylesterase [Dehalococcoidia bacterium]|nr:MAG: phospholipase/carboxylesterase [Dehalococcoidia bacterium]
MTALVHAVHRPARPSAHPPGLLVVHGWGADEHDLLGLAPWLDERLLIVSPRAPLRLDWGYGWYRFLPGRGAELESFTAALEQLERFATALPERYGIDPQFLFLLGFSQGAILSAALASLYPRQFRGVALLSGRLPPIPTEAQLAGLPVFLAHGRFDPVIPVEEGHQLAEALRTWGATVTTHYSDYGHEIPPATLRDLNAWLAPLLPEAG